MNTLEHIAKHRMAEQREAGAWMLEKEIGSGSFAKVWRATHKQTQQVAAVKEINLDKLSKKLQESLASEVAVLKHTQHHNIVCLLDLIKDANRLFLVLEFCAGGDLGHYLRRYKQVSEATARYFLQQVAEGLKELRRHNVIHRDLKPQNLLLSDGSSTPLLKIADFGFARSLAPQGLAETLCGSPLYMAPEILHFQKYDAKADLWSIGTILFELLVGKPPYNGANHIQLLRNIEASEARLPDHIAARLSPACRSLLGRLLQRNPVERLSFEEFFSHPFLAGEGQQGPCRGIPPPQLMPAASTAHTPPRAAVPAAMRQAAAAAAAAATADAGGPRPSSASMAKAHLHLTTSTVRPEPVPGHGATAPGGVQRQPQQSSPLAPARQHQEHYWHPQQQHAAGLVPQPVSQHPLAPVSGQAGGVCEVEALSDSMEGDYVVVHTPQSSTPHTRSSNSSKASSGLADPKAAAVLQGEHTPAAAARRAWLDAAAQPGGVQQRQQQQQGHWLPAVQQVGLTGCSVAHHQGPITVTAGAPSQQAWGAAAAGARSMMQHSSLQLPTTPLQRVQLLVQVVRGCVGVLASSSDSSGPRDTAGRPVLQDSERLALLLLALQVVQLLCCPDQDKAAAQQQEGGGAADADLAAVLAAASQSDVEALMGAVVELLKLANTHTRALAEQHGSVPPADFPHSTMATAAGGMQGSCCQQPNTSSSCVEAPGAAPVQQVAGASHMVASLLAVPLPDPASVLYHAALESCRAAAVEEVMGNWQPALDGYSLAADLLLFLAQDWPELPAPADPGLTPSERSVMQRLYAAASSRLTAVVAEAPPLALPC